MATCPFCSPAVDPQVVLSERSCYALWTEDGPPGSAMVLPWEHKVSVFDLTDDEWSDTKHMLERLKALIERVERPDGWNVGWNVGSVGGQQVAHAHCHLLPRYGDEPLAGRGIRFWIKDASNRRPGAGGPGRIDYLRHAAAPDRLASPGRD